MSDWRPFEPCRESEIAASVHTALDGEFPGTHVEVTRVVEVGMRAELWPDHDYVSAGDCTNTDGDRPYTGCYVCGRSRKEHSQP